MEVPSQCISSSLGEISTTALFRRTFWQFHPRIVHAFLVELEALQGMAVLGTISTSKPFCYDKLRQGGSVGPFLWDTIVRYLTCLIQDRWATHQWNVFRLDGYSVSPIWWADNFWIVSQNPEEGKYMLQDVVDVLYEHNLYIKPTSLKHLQAPKSTVYPYSVVNLAKKRQAKSTSLETMLSNLRPDSDFYSDPKPGTGKPARGRSPNFGFMDCWTFLKIGVL